MAVIDLGKVVPQKGVDYFTEAEVQQFKQDIEEDIPTKVSQLQNDSHFVNETQLRTKEDASNKTGNIDENSTTTQFPNAKAVYDKLVEKQNEIDALYDQIPTATVEGTSINVADSSNLPFKDVELKGNTTQATNILTYTCTGTESGDYYFVYDNTNYQFTMPTISAGDVLAFNTTTLKLYQGDTEITTTTASTGTLITLNATPNPDYPQDVKVVTGDVTVFTSGKNLFNIAEASCLKGDINAFLKTNDTIRITNQGAQTSGQYEWVVIYAIDVRDLKGKTITLSANVKPVSVDKAGRIYLALRNSNLDVKAGSAKYVSQGSVSYDIPEELDEYHYLAISLYGVTNGAGGEYVDYSDIQLEFGPATAYEPYTGQTQLISLGVKNLFDVSNVTYDNGHFINSSGEIQSTSLSGYTTSFIQVNPNTTYTISGKIGKGKSNYGAIYYYDSNQNWISRTIDTFGDEYTFTTPENCNFIQFKYALGHVDFSTIQLEDGKVAHSYSPYGQTPIELAKIGDYQDYIYKSGDKWYVHKAIGKFIFNGEQTFAASQREGVFVGNRFRYNGLAGVILRPSNNSIIAKILSTFLTANSANHNYNGGESISCDNNGQIYWYSPALAGYDIDQMNAWFEANNQILYYALATPTDTEITNSTLISQLESLLATSTVKNETNIFISTDNEQPILQVIYYKDLETLLNKVELLEARLELLEG